MSKLSFIIIFVASNNNFIKKEGYMNIYEHISYIIIYIYICLYIFIYILM